MEDSIDVGVKGGKLDYPTDVWKSEGFPSLNDRPAQGRKRRQHTVRFLVYSKSVATRRSVCFIN